MSGHSKWATTKRQKAVVDAKKGAVFTKIANMITIAAREKGGDPAANFSLRMAMDKAREANMPKDNVERAIKRGTGELSGAQIEELTYEGFGPAKSQFIVKCLTDNKNRSAATVRHLFSKYGGSFGTVMWNFTLKGVIRITNDELRMTNLDELELELIDIGVEDFAREDEGVTVFTKPENLQKVKSYLEEKKITAASTAVEYVAKEDQAVAGEEREKVERFILELEENEDVGDYYTNIIYK